MKTLILAFLVLSVSIVHAAEVTVLEAEVPRLESFNTMVDSRFQMNQSTGEGFVRVTVTENRPHWGGGHYDQWGRHFPHRTEIPVLVFQDTVKVDGLMLMNDEVVYHGAEGDVVCGKMGLSRIFKRPTIYLNGNCKLTGRLSGPSYHKKVIVTLKTK